MTRPDPSVDTRRRGALGLTVAGLGAAFLGLSGCTTVLGGGPVLDAYDLRPPADLPRARSRGGLELVIEPPTIPGALDSDRILIRPDPLQAQYLPGARWTETAPEVLRTLLIQSFEATGGLRQAGRRPLMRLADYRLAIEVLAFELDATAPGPVLADIRIAARLIDERGTSGAAARLFTAKVAAADGTTLAMVRALNTAAGQMTTDLLRWSLGRMGVALLPPETSPPETSPPANTPAAPVSAARPRPT